MFRVSFVLFVLAATENFFNYSTAKLSLILAISISRVEVLLSKRDRVKVSSDVDQQTRFEGHWTQMVSMHFFV